METSILTGHGQSYICAIDENECPSPHVESKRFMSLYCIADARAQTVSVSGPQQTSKPRVWDRMTLGRLLIGVCDVMYMYVRSTMLYVLVLARSETQLRVLRTCLGPICWWRLKRQAFVCLGFRLAAQARASQTTTLSPSQWRYFLVIIQFPGISSVAGIGW